MPTTEEFIERWTQIVHVLGNLARASRNRRNADIQRILQAEEVHSLYEYIDNNALFPDEEPYLVLSAELEKAATAVNYAQTKDLAEAILTTFTTINEVETGELEIVEEELVEVDIAMESDLDAIVITPEEEEEVVIVDEDTEVETVVVEEDEEEVEAPEEDDE